MVVLSLDGNSGRDERRDVTDYIPTPDQIRTACEEWTPQQERQRATRDRKRYEVRVVKEPTVEQSE